MRISLSPIEDFWVEMILMKVAGKDIYRFVLGQKGRDGSIWIHPIVKYQYTAFCLQRKATMKNICECHYFETLNFYSIREVATQFYQIAIWVTEIDALHNALEGMVPSLPW